MGKLSVSVNAKQSPGQAARAKNQQKRQQIGKSVKKKDNRGRHFSKLTRRVKKKEAAKLWVRYKGNVSKVCKKLGIQYTTFFKWLSKDKRFLNEIIASEGQLNDAIRDKLVELALKGNMTAIIFYLRKRHPDFVDKPTSLMQINTTGGMEVRFIREGDEPPKVKELPKPPKLPKDKQKLINGVKNQQLLIGQKTIG